MILLDTNIRIYIVNTKPPSVLARLWQHRERMPGRKSRLESQNLKGHPWLLVCLVRLLSGLR